MNIRESLLEINKIQGVIGSLLMDDQGNVIESLVTSEVDAKAVGQVVNSIYSANNKYMASMKQSSMEEAIIESTQGNIVLENTPGGVLVVVTQPQVNLGIIRVEARNLGQRYKPAENV